MDRRDFLHLTLAASTSAVTCTRVNLAAGSSAFAGPDFPVQFSKKHPYQDLYRHLEPGLDAFKLEKQAWEISEHLKRLPELQGLPQAASFRGVSPQPDRYSKPAEDVFKAIFDSSNTDFQNGMQEWLVALGEIRKTRFFVTEISREDEKVTAQIRYEISSKTEERLEYRVGHWKQIWVTGHLDYFEPLDETLTVSAKPWFADITAQSLESAKSFQQQLRHGVPYWRRRLDVAAGIDVYGSNGIAVGDIDNDGLDEIYVCQPGGLPNRLLKNRGDGTLVDISKEYGVAILDDTASALFVDLRNSGNQDLVILRSAGPLLLVNDGRGHFDLKPQAFRFASEPQGTFTGMAAADYDRDGRVDIYLCSYIYFQSEDQYAYPAPYHDSTNGPRNFLFRNRLNSDGSGFFEDLTEAVGLSQNNDRYSFAPAWCDYDGDGWPDLYVANDFGRNNLYKNENGQFRDVAQEVGVEDIGPGMSAAWFDYDGDGLLDLYVTNMWTAAGQRLTSQEPFTPAEKNKGAYHRHTKGSSLYRNQGDGTFKETGATEGVEMGRWSWSADAFDFDNDGAPEIYVTAGMLTNSSHTDLESFFWRQVVARSPTTMKSSARYENGWNALNRLIREGYSLNGREPNVFYVRRGDHYYDFSGVSGLDYAQDSRAFAVTDLDGDGNLDLLLKSRLGPQVRVLRNQCGMERRSLAIRLVGTRSNRDAVGAVVEVEMPTSGGTKNLVRHLQAGSGYLSQHTKVLYFGLGEARKTGKVHIRWPSGLEQEFQGLQAGYRYEIVEGNPRFKQTPFKPSQALSHRPESSNGNPMVTDQSDFGEEFAAIWLVEPVPLPESRSGPGFLFLTADKSLSAHPRLPVQVVDLRKNSDLASRYAVFRRYLFDRRTNELRPPLGFLFDERGRVHKFYPQVPDQSVLQADFDTLSRCLQNSCDLRKLALPFSGEYISLPHRSYWQLGTEYYWAGYFEQSLQYLSIAADRSPANFELLLSLGQVHLELGHHKQARYYVERAVHLNSQSAELWNTLGAVEMAAGSYQAALEGYNKALTLDPDLPHILVNAGEAHVKLGNLASAEQSFRHALKLQPDSAGASNRLGLLLARQNQLEEAEKYFKQAISLNQDDAGAINNLAVLYAQQNRLEEAKKYFKQVIEVKKDNVGAIKNLGILYVQQNQIEDAIATFQYGIQVAPEDENLYLSLARIYVKLGKKGAARDLMRRLLAQKPDSALARSALEELDKR